MRIWECQTGKPAQGVIRTEEGIVDVDWGPAGIRMVTASEGPLAYTWRVRTGQRVSEGMLHQAPVRVAAYGPNSQRIATGCADGTLRIWRVTSARRAKDCRRSAPTTPRSGAHFSARMGKGLVSCADDLTTIRWEMGTVRPIGRALPFDGGPVCAAYSPDRSFVVTVTANGKAYLTEGKSGASHGNRASSAPLRAGSISTATENIS